MSSSSLDSEQQSQIKDDAMLFDEITSASTKRKWFQNTTFQNPGIRIVVSGLIEAGKSTLVNSLTGTNKCHTEESSGNSCTTSVQKIKCEFGTPRTAVLVCDTPGFKFTDDDKIISDQIAKHKVYDSFKSERDCNIFIYAIKMSDTRFEANAPDLKVLKEITRKCGGKNWRNAVICLTNANICIADREDSHPDSDIKAWYHDRLREWTKELQRFMNSELCLEDNVIQNVPIVATGLPDEARLETEPQGSSWINKLWLAILSTSKESLHSQSFIYILEQKIFEGSEIGSSDVSYFLQSYQLCYANKAQRSKICSHDSERQRIVGLACSFLLLQKCMLKYHTSLQPLKNCDHALEFWKNASLSVGIVVAGNYGSGKTSLVNSLFYGKEKVPEGHGIEPSDKMSEGVFSQTELGLTCQVWDTPGCNIPQSVGNIKSVYSSNKVGVLIFCVSATEDNSSIRQSILNFTAEFGEDVWRNAVVALTFANTVADYESKVEETTGVISTIFREMSIGCNEEVPIVPAGYHTNVYNSSKQFWVINFWMKVISVTTTACQPVMITILNDVISRCVLKTSVKDMVFYYKHCLIDLLYSISLKYGLVGDTAL